MTMTTTTTTTMMILPLVVRCRGGSQVQPLALVDPHTSRAVLFRWGPGSWGVAGGTVAVHGVSNTAGAGASATRSAGRPGRGAAGFPWSITSIFSDLSIAPLFFHLDDLRYRYIRYCICRLFLAMVSMRRHAAPRNPTQDPATSGGQATGQRVGSPICQSNLPGNFHMCRNSSGIFNLRCHLF